MSSIIFTKSDCDFILSYWDDSKSIDGSGRGSYRLDDKNSVSFKRNVKGCYIDYNNLELIDFIVKRLSALSIKSISGVKIAKYSKGDYFEPHHDFNSYSRGAVYKTLVAQLSAPHSYIGGDLFVEGKPQPREQGAYSLFLSSSIHEVKLIEEGTRFSLVIFLFESDFNKAKVLI
jgi:Rps23 Pro-64 3,4-dihydroxylase Tpa1-like proline 4-hydroxylase